jgi:hypothetical protein
VCTEYGLKCLLSLFRCIVFLCPSSLLISLLDMLEQVAILDMWNPWNLALGLETPVSK